MSKEIIQHNNKKITKISKKSGDTSYSIKGVYIGTDVKTGKRITKTITAKTLKSLDRKIVEAKIQFEKAGSTIKETIQIDNFESLAEVWFSNSRRGYHLTILSIESEVTLIPISFLTLGTTNLTRLSLLMFNFG